MNDASNKTEPATPFINTLLTQSGETGRLIAGFDWAKTSLGGIDDWSQSLRTALGILLRSPVPIVMLWGEEGVMLYNDAYSIFAGGRHPDLLGSKVREGWPEVADFNDNVMKVGLAGGTLAYTDQELTLYRHGGPEQVWMNLDYSPVPDENGKPAGVIAVVIETTQKVLAERRANDERWRQQSMLQQMPGFAAVLNGPEHVFSYVNDAYTALTARSDLVGKTVREGFPDLMDQGIFERLDKVYAEGTPFIARNMPTRFEGAASGRYLDYVYQPIRDLSGQVVGVFVGGYDVTETRLASERINLALDSGTVIGTWVWEIPTDVFTGDERFAKTFSLDTESLRQGVRLSEVAQSIHPDDMARVEELVADVMARGGAYSAEYRVRHGTGWRWIEANGKVDLDDKGNPVRFPGVLIDIEARKAAELKLTAANDQLELAQKAGGIGIFSIPTGKTDLTVSSEFCRIFGFDDRPVLSADEIEALFLPEDERVHSTLKTRSSGEAVLDVVYRIRRHNDGALRWIARRGEFVYDANKRPIQMIGVVQDVTEREDRAQALADSEARLRQSEADLRHLNADLERQVAERTRELSQTWNISPDLLAVMLPDGMFESVNPAWTRLLGWSGEDLLRRPYTDFVHPEDMNRSLEAYEHVKDGQPVLRFENRYRDVNGKWHWLSWVAVPEGGKIYCTARDISVEKAAEAELMVAQEALRQAQKMEAVGQLTGGIAHDFNNMLAVVVGSLDLLNRRIGPEDPRGRRYVEAAMDGAKRCANLTQRLLAFSRQQPLRPESVNPNRLVSGMSDFLRHSIGADIRLETVLAAGAWRVTADPNQLENVILNLGVNARDAMPNGGRLTIETQNTHFDARYIANDPGLSVGQYVMIAITDTGTGMSADVIAKAFDPFFTTKEVGKGTGLGLSQVYGFVRQSGGHVKIYSEVGQGTTVKIYLPRSTENSERAEEELTGTEELRGDELELVLVVDDEPAVRQFSADAFTALGYRVLEADGAEAALRLIDQYSDISLLFTDIVMPDTNGRKLADKARDKRPDLKVLYTTGYTRNAVVHNGIVDQGVELIGKPFTIDELAARVRAILDKA